MSEPPPTSSNPSSADRPKGSIITNYFLIILFGFACLQLLLNIQQDVADHQQDHILAFQKRHFIKSHSKSRQEYPSPLDEEENNSPPDEQEAEESPEEQEEQLREHEQLAGLDCKPHGGPPDASEMVYWEDIPSDATYISPFQKEGRKQYLTFEADHGGWNNIRMAMETVMTMSVAMGRTLVLPPEQSMYLLDKAHPTGSQQRRHFSFAHFFPMELIEQEYEGLEIITMDEFLKREGLAGNLRDTKTGQVVFPPGNRTNYDGEAHNVIATKLERYLQKVGRVPPWDPEECLMAFPQTSDPKDVKALQDIFVSFGGNFPSYEKWVDNPHPVDAPAIDRMKENWAGRNRLCIYDQEWQDVQLIHFSEGNKGEEGARLLVHFYAFLFFEDWRHDLWMKRFVRDHVRYIDEVQCAAARIIKALRERVKARGDPSGEYNAYHIRRGDFQYTVTRFDAPHIIRNSAPEVPPNSTVYIATDEKDRKFFEPFKEIYDVLFLEDFHHLLEGINSNHYGMIDSLIASRSKTFFGCWFSTFTGYINRLRGYHNNKNKGFGYEQGHMQSFYYALDDRKYHMQQFYPVKKSFYAREFPTSWRLIDNGIGELQHLTINKN